MCLDEATPRNQGAVPAQGIECLVIFLDPYRISYLVQTGLIGKACRRPGNLLLIYARVAFMALILCPYVSLLWTSFPASDGIVISTQYEFMQPMKMECCRSGKLESNATRCLCGILNSFRHFFGQRAWKNNDSILS